MKKRTPLFVLVAIAVLLFASCSSKEAEAMYQQAKQAFDSREWDSAITIAQDVIAAYPDSSVSALAEKLIEDAKTSKYSSEAKQSYSDIEQKYASSLWDECLQMAKEFVVDYPDVEETAKARSLITDCDKHIQEKMLSDMSAKYSDKLWDECLELAEAFNTDYPESTDAAEIQGIINNCKAHIKFNMALADYEAGQYQIAISNLNTVIKKYPNADINNEAKELLPVWKNEYVENLYDTLLAEYENQDWNLVFQISNEIVGVLPSSDIADEAKQYADYAKGQLVLVSWREDLQKAYESENWNIVKKTAEYIIEDYPNTEDARIAQKYLSEFYEQEKQKAREIIRVTKVNYYMNSVGGAEVHFNFVNNSSKTIKYITFGVSFYNAVGDILRPDYDRRAINYCSVTGPYGTGEGMSGNNNYWGPFYDWDISTVKLVSLEIEYTDGTKVTLTKEQLDYIQY